MDRRTYLKQTLVLSGGVLLPLGAMIVLGRPLPKPNATLLGFNGSIMGTSYSVQVAASQTNLLDNRTSKSGELSQRLNSLRQGSHQVLQAVDHAMSTWQRDSELSIFNHNTSTDQQLLSASTFSVVESALAMSRLTSGAFDASVSPLVDLWGFGALSGNLSGTTKPTARQISSLLSQVNYRHIVTDQETLSVSKAHVNAQLDLSSIAKGYAVDQLFNFVSQSGFKHFMVEVGGELRASAGKPNGKPWRVAIEHPQAKASQAFRVVDIDNMAIATSGDYRHFVQYGATRYSHIIDPRTGYPTSHEITSASVVAPSTVMADALSTALMIMGPAAAIDFANSNNIAAHLILRSKNDNFAQTYSREFERYFVSV